LKNSKIIVIAAVLTLTTSGCITEHLREHPGIGKLFGAEKIKKLKEEYSAAVIKYVVDQSVKSGGAFVIKDPKLQKEWRLKLVRIHDQKIVNIEKDRYFACADFEEVDGTSKLDLDFYAKHSENNWAVEEVLIHKVNNKKRFSYNRKNQRIPVEE